MAKERVARGSKAPASRGARSTLREAQKEFTRRTLVESARVAFERHGYVDVTVDDIVDGAGASRATFYLYFNNKADVLMAVGEPIGDEYSILMSRLSHVEARTVEGLAQWLDWYVDFYEKHRLLLKAVAQAQVIDPVVVQQARKGVEASLEVWRQNGMLEYQDSDNIDEVRLRAVLFNAQVDRFMQLWILEGWEFERQSVIWELAQQWHAVLQPRGERSRSATTTADNGPLT